MRTSGNQPLEILRALLLALLAFGLLGTSVDLLFLEHYESGWQIVPLILLALGLFAVAWAVYMRSWLAVAVLRTTMGLVIVAGVFGIVLHFQSNREFQKEIDPALDGWPLVVAVLHAKAPPVLAPASMIQLGLLGLICTFRQPGVAHKP